MSKEASKRNPFYDIDIFGQSIPLRFQQRAEYNTKCGVISSLLLFCTLITLIIISLSQILHRSTFTIIISTYTNTS